MKKKLYAALGLGLAVLLSGLTISCDSQRNANRQTANDQQTQDLPVGDSSMTSVDWAGTYYGVMPCADCPGLETALTLELDGTYELQTRYQERGDSIYVDKGSFTWDDTGGNITLLGSDGVQYKVGENRVFLLDQDGNRIEGALADHYTLIKNKVEDVYWSLIEINGQSIEDLPLMREPYMRLNSDDQRAEANGGCNGMGGSYELDESEFSLRFSQFISTKMACENMEIEQQLAQVIEQTDHYAVGNNQLELFDAEGSKLAQFRAIYIK